MRYISGNYEDEIGKFIGLWFQENTGYVLYEPYSAIGISNGISLIGAVIFTDYNDSNVEMHIYAPKCISKGFIKYLANYVFNELKCNVLRAKPRSNNTKAVTCLKKLDFTLECVLDDYYGKNEHALMFRYKRYKAIKWINLDA